MADLIRQLRRRWSHRLPPAPPRPTRLDMRPELTDREVGRFTWGYLTVSNPTRGSKVHVGQFCSLAYGTHVLLGGEHRADFVSTYRFPAYEPFKERYGYLNPETVTTRGDVFIGNDVWTGHNVLITSGVTIGDGAIIGTGSVVRSNIPPYAIVAGNPARVAGYRFTKEQISDLLEIRWWDWPLAKIENAIPLLMSDDIQAFIDEFKDR